MELEQIQEADGNYYLCIKVSGDAPVQELGREVITCINNYYNKEVTNDAGN